MLGVRQPATSEDALTDMGGDPHNMEDSVQLNAVKH